MNSFPNNIAHSPVTDSWNDRHPRVQMEVAALPAMTCYVCGASGDIIYRNIHDRLFAAPGVWNIRRCHNSSCGLLWLDPKPLESELGKLYANYYTHRDPERNSLPRQIFQYLRDGYLNRICGYKSTTITSTQKLSSVLLNLYPPKRSDFDFPMLYLRKLPKGRLLDVGCGAGLTLELAQNSGWLAEGVDVDEAAVENARNKGLNADSGKLDQLKFPAESFDAVVLNHVIEHVYDPSAMLRECWRILRHNGCLLVNTPNSKSLGHEWFGKDWVALDPPRHLHVFAASSLKTLVAAAGFAGIAIEPASGRAAGVLTASRSIRNTGRFDMSQTPDLRGRFAEAIAWTSGFWRLAAGEELRLAAQKIDGRAARGH